MDQSSARFLTPDEAEHLEHTEAFKMALRGKTSTRPGYKPGVDIHPTIVAAFPPVVEEKKEAPKKKRSLFGKKKDK